jgi:hypothetical protein
MAQSCNQLRTNFAFQTPVYKDMFLKDYISDMCHAPYLGRHMTDVWPDGLDTLYFDKIRVPQANFLSPWQRRAINNDNCTSPTVFPRSFIQWGTTRYTSFMEGKFLQSQTQNLEQLRMVPKLGKQVAEIYRILRQMPLAFLGDFLRTRFASYNPTIQICNAAFGNLAVTTTNTDIGLASINLGGTANLPDSELTLTYLEYWANVLGMRGYDKESGLARGMRNLVTHPRVYQKLVGLNPEVRSQFFPVTVKDISPLYMEGTGINAQPFGPMAPTFDDHQARFQHAGNGVLNRVLPYVNVPTSTGAAPVENSAYVNATYALSTILHPKAALLYTAQPTKVHEMIPTINNAMWGTWDFINPQGVIQWTNPDGTVCQQNNDTQWWFYWLCYLEYGFEYQQDYLVLPILHKIDGSGKACFVSQPVCGTDPQYVAQNYSDDPIEC